MINNIDRDDLLLLLIRRQENCTSWEEERLIDQILRQDEDAREMAEDVRVTYENLAKVPQTSAQVRVQSFINMEIPRSVEERRAALPKRRRYLNFAAAGIVALATSAIALYFPFYEKHAPTVTHLKGVTLAMAGGDAVALGMNNDTIVASAAMLHTNASMLYFTAKTGDPNAGRDNTITVPAGNMYSLTLADGSVVHLNAATILRFPFAFTGPKREVFVDGEAFFNVAANANQPFIVHSKKKDVQVLGTSFNINTYDDHFLLSLISGKVAVTDVIMQPVTAKGSVKLSPCQKAVLDPKTKRMEIEAVNGSSELSWLQGIYRFQQEPLAEVCKVAERLYGVTFKLDSEELGKVTYTGILHKNDSVDVFLKNLKNNGKVAAYEQDWDGTVLLRGQ
ncbi:FecR family protein [Chitinophaga sp. GbtcB8]|uniref:FecR family protein n=1 Tax=Chitinophaga sp. GbtcB8 TaxID=2824753 RepID=UPI001C30A055|nr:FecR domain-containing protein [Chitinophaga sp. GbtcB8]